MCRIERISRGSSAEASLPQDALERRVMDDGLDLKQRPSDELERFEPLVRRHALRFRRREQSTRDDASHSSCDMPSVMS